MFFAHRKNYRKLLRFLCALPNISQIFAVFFMQCKKYCKNMRNFCGFFCAPQNILQIFAVFFTQRLETIWELRRCKYLQRCKFLRRCKYLLIQNRGERRSDSWAEVEEVKSLVWQEMWTAKLLPLQIWSGFEHIQVCNQHSLATRTFCSVKQALVADSCVKGKVLKWTWLTGRQTLGLGLQWNHVHFLIFVLLFFIFVSAWQGTGWFGSARKQ